MSDTVYGERWNKSLRFMIDVISVEEARRRFDEGPWFSVAVGRGLNTSFTEAKAAARNKELLPVPRYSIEMLPGPTFAKTIFYNEHGSIDAIHSFRQVDHRTMFLDEFVYYTYPDEPRYFWMRESLTIDFIRFSAEGTSRHEHHDKSTQMVEAIDRKEVDLAKNWEPVPRFGDWESLGRPDRRPGVDPASQWIGRMR